MQTKFLALLCLVLSIFACSGTESNLALNGQVHNSRENNEAKISIRANFSDMFRNKHLSKEYNAAELDYWSKGQLVTVPSVVRVRGHGSLLNCEFPKLKLKPSRNSNSIFSDKKAFRIQTHCKSPRTYVEKHAKREYLIYKFASEYLQFSLEATPVQFEYIDESLVPLQMFQAGPISKFGFLIQNPKEHNEPEEIDGDLLTKYFSKTSDSAFDTEKFIGDFHQKELLQVALLQTFIGNIDWDVGHINEWAHYWQNVEILKLRGKFIALPYGFDLSSILVSDVHSIDSWLQNTKLDPKSEGRTALERRYDYMLRKLKNTFSNMFLDELNIFSIRIYDFLSKELPSLDEEGQIVFREHLKHFLHIASSEL